MLEADRFADVAEMAQCQLKRANELLAHGWKLLAIVTTANWSTAKGGNAGYVHKGVLYVVGRPEGVEALDANAGNGATNEANRLAGA